MATTAQTESQVQGMVGQPDGVTSPSSNPAAAPSASISPTHFSHQPASARPVHAMLDMGHPAINTVPVELDSTPISPISRKGTWKDQLSAIAAVNDGEDNTTEGAVKQDQAKLRTDDPAVLLGPPGTPGAEDFKAVETEKVQS